MKVESSVIIYNVQQWSELTAEKFEFTQFLDAFVKLSVTAVLRNQFQVSVVMSAPRSPTGA